MRFVHVVGARPNFMKVAPVYAALASRGVAQTLVHTGQHYDDRMSRVFFEQLGIPAPDINLDVKSGSHAEQTAKVMLGFERVVEGNSFDYALVYGDVNSTVAAALVCAKLGLPVAHVEAGLRSFDRRMPEEINRLLTDQLADILFTPSADGDANLLREGVDARKIHLVGNVMIDTLQRFLPLAERLARPTVPPRYALVTLHRPSNVDDEVVLGRLMRALARISRRLPVLFPIHPRTQQRLARLPGVELPPDIRLLDPLGYLEFISLEREATAVITDSGGVQEETTYLGVPCLTLRENTERPVTVEVGTNLLLGYDYDRLEEEVAHILAGRGKRGAVPPLWDGQAAQRIADVLLQLDRMNP